MKNTYKDLVDYAYSLVNIINRNYLNGKTTAYPVLLFGIGNCLVEGVPGSGHNYQAVIDAVHLFWIDFPDSRANVGLQEGILDIISDTADIKTVQLVFNCITYEMKKEQEKSNTFCLDCQKLLVELRRKIDKNYKDIKNEYPNIDSWLEDSALYVKENFGYHF